MSNIIICSIIFGLIIIAIKAIIKNKGTCHCGRNDCQCCDKHYSNNKN